MKIIVRITFLLAIVFFAVNTIRPINIYDEGFVLTNSENILKGLVPYRDFWTIYSPGQYYVLATVFKLFGTSLITSRFYDTIVRLLLAIVLYRIAKSVTSHRKAFIYLIGIIALLGSTGFFTYPVFPSLLFVGLAILSTNEFTRTENKKYVFISGLFNAIAGLFRHDFGVYLFIASLAVLIVYSLWPWTKIKRISSQKITAIFFITLKYLLGIAIITIPVGAYFLSTVPLKNLWFDLIGYQLYVLQGIRKLPYPSFFPLEQIINAKNISSILITLRAWVEFYFPFGVYTATALTILQNIIKLKNLTDSDRQNIFLTIHLLLIGTLLLSQSLSRADHIHYLPTTLIALLLFIRLVSTLTLNIKNIPSYILICLFCIIVTKTYYYDLLRTWLSTASTITSILSRQEWRPIRASYIPTEPDQAQAIKYMQEVVPLNEKIFVGLSRHDRAFINDASFYFLAERSSPKHYELDPGFVTTDTVQNEIIHELGSSSITHIVLFSRYENTTEPNGSAISSGITVLDDYIRNNYEKIAEYGDYAIYRRKQ